MVRLLVVEDDAAVREAVAAYLQRVGHDVVAVADGIAAVDTYAADPVDLVLLDLMLPGLGGIEVTRRLRSIRPDLPIIMVTARSQEHERVQGLALGADDYVTKPFSLRELDLRIKSVLRRAGASPQELPEAQLVDGELRLDLAARTARRGADALSLTTREFDLLAWFLRHPGRTWSREELMSQVWGWEVGDASTVTVHVRRLREKIEPDPGAPTRLLTVFGHGYRWESG